MGATKRQHAKPSKSTEHVRVRGSVLQRKILDSIGADRRAKPVSRRAPNKNSGGKGARRFRGAAGIRADVPVAGRLQWAWTEASQSKQKPVFCDLETRSVVDLRTVGGKRYLEHCSTQLLSAQFLVDGLTILWVPRGRGPVGLDTLRLDPVKGTKLVLLQDRKCPEQICDLVKRPWVAHNAEGFDAFAWAQLVPTCPPPRWVDTQPLARAAGLPGGLDALGKLLCGRGKDDMGTRAMKLLSTGKVVKGEPCYNIGTLPLWQKFLQYGVMDVELLEVVWDAVTPIRDPDFLQAHSAINVRGVKIDRTLLQKLSLFWKEAKATATDRVAELTDDALTIENIRSVKQVHQWLAAQGVQVVDATGRLTLRREEIEIMMNDPEEYFYDGESFGKNGQKVVEVLSERITALKTSDNKVERLLEIADEDDRVRNLLVANAAQTGRRSSRGVQIHNLYRGNADVDVEGLIRKGRNLSYANVQQAAKEAETTPDVVLSTLLRPCFLGTDGPLSICDYAAVEGRGVAWIAEEEGALEIYRDPKGDPYCAMAAKIYGREVTKKDKTERQVGKVTSLGAGYGMGPDKFTLFSRSAKVDLAAAGTTAEACITGFREANKRIVSVWREVQDAAHIAAKGGRASAGKCEFSRSGGELRIVLPSGRPLCYRDPALAWECPNWAKLRGMTDFKALVLTYTHPFGYRKTLYGGLLVENIVQAIANDLLREALKECHAAGLQTVMDVHDEIVDDDDRLEELAVIMSKPPAWAKGFPIMVEGYTCPRYSKTPFEGARHVKALDGRIV